MNNHNHVHWASLLIRRFYELGVRHAVISPGSRSTPLTAALASHPGFKKKVVIDERSAAFFALGIGKESGLPALLICTSGTAAANYYPAVIEARQSGVPLVILSADRPPSMRSTGSSQTIDQIKLYGNYPVYFHEAGEPLFSDEDLSRLQLAATQAVDFSVATGGASHINLAFRKPLEPASGDLERELKLNIEQTEQESSQHSNRLKSQSTVDSSVWKTISDAQKPLLIAGPANPAHAASDLIHQLSGHFNIPVLSEPGSQIGTSGMTIRRFGRILSADSEGLTFKPDLILRFGDQPVSKTLNQSLNRWRSVTTLQFLTRKTWQDATISVDERYSISTDIKPDLTLFKPSTNPHWAKSWQKADESANEILLDTLEDEKNLTDGHIFHHFSKVAGETWSVLYSNSFPVRDAAMFGESRPGQFVNRGAAGIDGVLSTAAGIHASGQKATCCLVGDIAFLHDANALYSLQRTGRPFLIVVINNGGGTIFGMLPIHRHDELFRNYFLTPQKVKFQKLAEANSIPYQKITTLDQLKGINPGTFGKGAHIVEIVTNAEKSLAMRKKLSATS